MGSEAIEAIGELQRYLTPEERAQIDRLLAPVIWQPLPGPQMEAYYSPADVLFYGGSAGGGKSDLPIGLTLTAHRRSIIYRREAKQLQAIIDRLAELVGGRDGFSSQSGVWRPPGRPRSR